VKVWPMFCKACGQSIDRGDKFCRNCGVALAQEPFEAAVAASASTQGGETPLVVATSTAELQRPLPIPKNKLLEPAIESAMSPSAGESKTGLQQAAREDAAVKPVTEAPAPSTEAVAQPKTEPEGWLPEVAATPTPKSQPEGAGVAAQTAMVAMAAPAPAKADNTEAAAARPVRLCPQCRRLVGDEDVICERCKARLEPTAAPQPATVSADYGVPSFAGYAEKADKRETAKAADQAPVADPSGVDAISNLRLPRRRRLPFVEILVAVILLGGAGVAVWMMRSGLPGKATTQSVNVDVTISPTRAKVTAGHGYDLAATVTGTDNYNVDWSVDEGDGGGRIVPRGAKAKDGSVSSLAVYMAPKTPGTYHVTATSKADSGKSASATITVTK